MQPGGPANAAPSPWRHFSWGARAYVKSQKMSAHTRTHLADATASATPSAQTETQCAAPADRRSALEFGLYSVKYAVPGLLLGHLLDEIGDKRGIAVPVVGRVRGALWQLIAQLGAIVALMYVISLAAPDYGSDFQTGYGGLLFVSLFFAMQPNLVANAKSLLAA